MRYPRLAPLLLVAVLLGAAPAPPARAADCQLVLGFATLHDLIPRQVGQCLEDERHNPANGDGLQMTTGGLLVWRKADNFTAFTDGSRSWVNGPFGLQRRLNGQRFSWEWNPDRLPIVPRPAPGERCHTAGLSLSTQEGGAAAGHAGFTLRFTNDLAVPCTFFSYVGGQMLDAQLNPLPTRVVRGGGFIFQDPGPSLVTVPAGGSAVFGLEWSDVPVGNETTCPQASLVQVTPPDEFVPIVIPLSPVACGGGVLHVTAVRPGG